MLINFPLIICADSHCWKIGSLFPLIIHGSQVPNQCYKSLSVPHEHFGKPQDGTLPALNYYLKALHIEVFRDVHEVQRLVALNRHLAPVNK